MTTLNINNQAVTVDAPPDTPLLWILRDYLGMTGTKFGCGATLCRACTVHVDGQATFSCVLPISAVEGRKITTIEGVTGRVAEAVQNAWDKIQVPQCGYCQSGQVMSAVALLSNNKTPSDAEIDVAMQGNLCRCGTYQRIRAAIQDAAKQLGGSA
ncbi:MAG TPA: (2Fe-2S)-binding protein [Paraburkholderia sp.]|uniref:(2Fe-2S)-binding protein n=1 Tax=Paraburkholderia sp. TaxID=1926495 RepID=UPI002C54AB93|nr:(2Fe-2S)-binding protein [Paraburkholderia sp.]HTR07046.1 (2Fe-2S)-binding protein [Paraburkholderia sp.]